MTQEQAASNVKIATQARAVLTKKLIDRVTEMEISPLEVMLHTMKLHYDQGQQALEMREGVEDADQRAHLMRLAQLEMGASSQVAEKVAPYLHPKLQTTTLKGDDKNPLNLVANLRNLSDSELTTMQLLMTKVNDDVIDS